MDINDIFQVLQDIQSKKWLALAVLVLGYLSTLFSNASRFPVNIPERFRPLLVILFGQGYAVVEAVASGENWQPAVGHGIVLAFMTLGLGTVLEHVIFPNGLPTWLSWAKVLAFVPPKLAVLPSRVANDAEIADSVKKAA